MKLLLLLALVAGAASAAPAPSLSVAPQQKNLQSVRQEIDTLQKDIAAKEAVRKQAQTAIAKSQQAISKTDQMIAALGQKQTASTRQLSELRAELEAMRQKIASARQQVARMLASQYKNGNHDAMRLMLNATDPNQTSRDLVYYQRIVAAQQQLITELNTRQQQLAQLSDALQQQIERLDTLSSRKSKEKSQLQQDKSSTEQKLGQIASQIQDRQQKLSQLKQDEKHLTDVIAQINREIARQQEIAARKAAQARLAASKAAKAARAAAIAENARRRKIAAEAKKQGKPVPAEAQQPVAEPAAAPETVDTVADTSAAGRAFRSLQGHMRLPVAGEIAGKFGAMRSEGTTWKGLFIRTARGQGVHVVADGHIVYADALRGFGNAVIVDHGGNYLTVYTGLSTMSHGIGDKVRAGETLGNTGALDSGDAGLYFEIRYLGKPINPQTWTH
ncbi:murein hydrolase activator EnvC family protein [Paludibacterium yongneupense]|uniref:murein hydrolase activator EnvC family protein n=1 Tax=Paludibacterium yongneupense TaxID=400061 RepID=UPI000490C560|nr:peptidoglycan DD-metalloendopeptidase family protein [Paludibacterium yongneupense]